MPPASLQDGYALFGQFLHRQAARSRRVHAPCWLPTFISPIEPFSTLAYSVAGGAMAKMRAGRGIKGRLEPRMERPQECFRSLCVISCMRFFVLENMQ